MVVKIKQSIKNSKNVAQWKKRQADKRHKKHKAANADKNRYVDKRAKAKEEEKEEEQDEYSYDPEEEGEEEIKEAASDHEMADEAEPENLDDAEFEKFQEGELDLPEDSEEAEASESDEVEDDSELDEYYRELGIDPDEMKSKD